MSNPVLDQNQNQTPVMSDLPIVVTGASSIIGQPVMKRLLAKQLQILPVCRKGLHGVQAIPWDMQNNQGYDALQTALGSSAFDWVHCAPIWLLPHQLPALIELGLRRLIVFSSSSIEGKTNSHSQSEQSLVQQLNLAEESVIASCQAANVDYTIFRPTMIYGYGQGQNLAFIAAVIRRFKCFPVASPALGLRQPVHADDLANAVGLALYNTKTYGKTYTLSGGETLTYQAMVQRLFIALDYSPRVMQIPLPLYRFALSLMRQGGRLLGKTLPIDPAMADRMQQDLSFEHSAASHDFDYAPGPFLPNGVHDLLITNY